MQTHKRAKADPGPALTKAVLRAADIMGLNQATLAKVLGISPASISRMRGGDYLLNPAGKEWELAMLLVRLFRGLDAIMAGDEAALRAWLDSYNTALNDNPRALLTQAAGLTRTVDYVVGDRARVCGTCGEGRDLARGGRSAPRLHPQARRHRRGARPTGGTARPGQAALSRGDGRAALSAQDPVSLSPAAAVRFAFSPTAVRRWCLLCLRRHTHCARRARLLAAQIFSRCARRGAAASRGAPHGISARYATKHRLDLTQAPLDEDRKRWTRPADYSETPALAARAREAGIEAIRYESVRDVQQGANIALRTPEAFVGKKPLTQQTWFLYLAAAEVNFTRAHARGAKDRWVFPVTQFA